MQRRSSIEEKNPPVTIRGTLVSVFSNMGERIATFREQVHYKQAHDHAQGVPRLKQNVRNSIYQASYKVFFKGATLYNAIVVCWPSRPKSICLY